jgi:hypothetical protein
LPTHDLAVYVGRPALLDPAQRSPSRYVPSSALQAIDGDGAAAGAFIAGTFGATTTITAGIFHYGSVVVVGSSAVTSVSAPLLAAAAGTGSWAAQVATGKIADMAIIQCVVLSKAIAAGEVVIVAGVPMGVVAAISAGLIAIVILGAYAYYVLTKDAVEAGDQGQGLPSPA